MVVVVVVVIAVVVAVTNMFFSTLRVDASVNEVWVIVVLWKQKQAWNYETEKKREQTTETTALFVALRTHNKR